MKQNVQRIDIPFLAKGKIQKEKTSTFVSNIIKVHQIVPRQDLESTGNIASRISVACDGQFKNKMIATVPSLCQCSRKPECQAWIECSNHFDMVIALGPEGQHVMNKGGCLVA